MTTKFIFSSGLANPLHADLGNRRFCVIETAGAKTTSTSAEPMQVRRSVALRIAQDLRSKHPGWPESRILSTAKAAATEQIQRNCPALHVDKTGGAQ